MGHVYVDVKISNPNRDKVAVQRMLVDTGATYTCLPYPLAKQLSLPLFAKSKIMLADGREVDASNSLAYVEMNGRADILHVRVLDIIEPIVGVFTLEALGLAVDPVSGEPNPTRSFIARA